MSGQPGVSSVTKICLALIHFYAPVCYLSWKVRVQGASGAQVLCTIPAHIVLSSFAVLFLIHCLRTSPFVLSLLSLVHNKHSVAVAGVHTCPSKDKVFHSGR